MTAKRGAEAAFPETADVETSSDDYASRFAGEVGAWFLDEQARTTIELLRSVPSGAKLLDVGGGHAQLTPALVAAGYDVVVLGSAPVCAARLEPWLGAGRCRFEVGNVVALPYGDRSFDAVLSFRLLPHVRAWQRLLAELCRVADRLVIVDYPSRRSINVVADALFEAKKRVERNTRPFTLFRPRAIADEFSARGFRVTASRPQFLWPMVLHRMMARRAISRALEAPARALGLTRTLGSPVIVCARR